MTNSEPLISVIMATFNRADLIGEAIDSVLHQSYRNLELIIVDDGSTDDTASLIGTKYASESRLKYIYQENTGQSGARNNALTVTKGQFICFIDSDNVWLPNKLQLQVRAFGNDPSVDIVYGDIITIDETGDELHRNNMKRYSGFIAGRLLKDNFVSMNTALAKRSCFDELGGMGGEVEVADDYDLWLRFSSKFKFLYLPEYFAKYRVMENQISTDKTRRFKSTEAIVRKFISQYPEATTNAEKRLGLSHFYIRKAYYHIGERQYGDAFKTGVQAIKHKPDYIVAYRVTLKSILSFIGLVK